MNNKNDNLFNLDESNFTNDFFHLNNPNQTFSLPYSFNGDSSNITIREDVPIHNAKTIDLPKMQANPNAFNQNIKNRDLVDLLAKHAERFDTKARIEYSCIKVWRSTDKKRYNEVNQLYDAIRNAVQIKRNNLRVRSGQTKGYKQEWEDEDIIKTFTTLINSSEYQSIKEGKGYDPKKKTSSERYKIH